MSVEILHEGLRIFFGFLGRPVEKTDSAKRGYPVGQQPITTYPKHEPQSPNQSANQPPRQSEKPQTKSSQKPS